MVDSDGVAVGIVTATDLLDDHNEGTPISKFMSTRVYTVPRYDQPHIAARVMRNHHIHHVVVTEDKKVVGMVSSFDLLRLIAWMALRGALGPPEPHPDGEVHRPVGRPARLVVR